MLPWISELQMGFVALAFAAIMLIRYKSEADTFYRAVDWDLLGFFAALFTVIYVLEHALTPSQSVSGSRRGSRRRSPPTRMRKSDHHQSPGYPEE